MNQLVHNFNIIAKPSACDKTVTDLFEAKVRQRPDHTALVCRNCELTYRELNKRSNQLAYYLQRKYDIGPGDTVAIVMQRNEWLLTGILGILKSGAACLPIDASHTDEYISSILEDANVKLLLTDSQDREGSPCLVMRTAWDSITTITDRKPSCVSNPADPAYIIYTQVCGEKLQCMSISHRAVVNTLINMEKEITVTAKDRLLAVSAQPLDMWMLEFFLPLVSGAEILLATREEAFDLSLLQYLMQKKQPTIMHAPPSFWSTLLETGWEAWPGLKILCAGEHVSAELDKKLTNMQATCWQLNGVSPLNAIPLAQNINEIAISYAIPLEVAAKAG
ncbi:MAG: AMP-binding protein [Chitinophagaceae bacterium]